MDSWQVPARSRKLACMHTHMLACMLDVAQVLKGCYACPLLATAKVGDRFQFERLGCVLFFFSLFFCVCCVLPAAGCVASLIRVLYVVRR